GRGAAGGARRSARPRPAARRSARQNGRQRAASGGLRAPAQSAAVPLVRPRRALAGPRALLPAAGGAHPAVLRAGDGAPGHGAHPHRTSAARAVAARAAARRRRVTAGGNLVELLDRHVAGLDGVSRRLWERALAGPVREFLRRPGKGMRGRLVEAAFQLVGGAELGPDLPAALELLHAGSLVLDDIQDASLERRGGPALHRVCGTGVALNAGNWMVFWSVQMIGQAKFP